MRNASNALFGVAALLLLAGIAYSFFMGLAELAFTAFAAWISGRALALGWKPAWTCIPYMALLGLADLFMVWAIVDNFGHELPGWAARVGSVLGREDRFGAWLGFCLGRYAIDTFLITGVALVAHRLTLARRMVKQYPWLYDADGPFAWRARTP